MIPYLRGEKPVVFAASSYKAILETIEFADKHRLRCVISGGAQAWKLADTLAQKKIPVILGPVTSYPRGRFEAWDSVYSCERAAYALSLGAARILGIDDRAGSIEPGKQADLIVTTHSPLQTVFRVTHMFIDGRPIDLTNKHTRDYQRFKNRPTPTLPPPPDLLGPPSLTE
jgi:hypothetical protein